MNYRQWKKNYKKLHGYNPPLKDDKRKQRKAQAKQLQSIDFSKLAENIAAAVKVASANIFKVLGEMFAAAGKVATEIGEELERDKL